MFRQILFCQVSSHIFYLLCRYIFEADYDSNHNARLDMRFDSTVATGIATDTFCWITDTVVVVVVGLRTGGTCLVK